MQQLSKIDALWNDNGSDPEIEANPWPISITMATANAEEREWSAAHWRATVEPRWAHTEQIHLRSIYDDKVYHELEGWLSASSTRLEGHGYPGLYSFTKIGDYACWFASRVDDLSGHVVIKLSSGRWLIVNEPCVDARKTMKRVGAEHLLAAVLSSRGIQMHSSAAIYRGIGCVFVGPSGAGKTTIALAAARHGYYISGDRTALVRVGRECRAVGFPDATNLGLGFTIALGIADLLPHRSLVRPQQLPITSEAIRSTASLGLRKKIVLTNAELETILGVPIARGTTVGCAVMLNRSGDNRLRARRLPECPQQLIAELIQPTLNGHGAEHEQDGIHHGDGSQASQLPLQGTAAWLSYHHNRDHNPSTFLRTTDLVSASLDGIPILCLDWNPTIHDPDEALTALMGLL